MRSLEVKAGRTFVCRLDYEADMIGAIKAFAKKKGISSASFQLLGAVKRAKISYYNQADKRYSEKLVEKPMEIVACQGNIAKMGEEVVVHAHVVLSDENGATCGGHVLEGTTIFAGELILIELRDVNLTRSFDEVTGLNQLNIP